MKKVLLSLAAVSAIAVAVPAAAQPYGAAYGYHNNNNHRAERVSINDRQAQLAQRIDSAFRRGEISRSEAGRLMAELRQTEVLEYRMRQGGLSRWERDELNARLDRVAQLIRQERREDNRRYGYGYGRW